MSSYDSVIIRALVYICQELKYQELKCLLLLTLTKMKTRKKKKKKNYCECSGVDRTSSDEKSVQM